MDLGAGGGAPQHVLLPGEGSTAACSTAALHSWPLQVYDGVSLATCRVNTNQTFSYTAGTLVGGLVEWYRLDHNSSHLELAHNIASSVIR